jgi:hypothetical protein
LSKHPFSGPMYYREENYESKIHMSEMSLPYSLLLLRLETLSRPRKTKLRKETHSPQKRGS